MRTHSKYELQDSSTIAEESSKESVGYSGQSENINGEAFKFVKKEVVDS